MPAERFERLEGGQPLPQPVQQALSRLGRFDHLEIGAARPAAPALAPAPGTPEKILCLNCGQPNEAGRQTCWACFRPLSGPKPAAKRPDDITIVLDGTTYRSSDPGLPSDVKTLIEQIRAKGYSPELLAQWRTWRATRNEPKPAERPFDETENLVPVENNGKDPLTGNEVFKGQRATVIRLDGKFYTSDDKDLSPELRELFGYIDVHGVTPELMEHLRQVGKKAVVRPATTHAPTAEDLAFWKDAPGPSAAAAPVESAPSGGQSTAFLVAVAAAGLYILLRLLAARGHP